MWTFLSGIVGPVIDGLIKVSGYIAAYFAGEKAQQAKDEQKVVDAASTRAQVDAADNQLTDQQLRDRLRGKS